jgi:hypothetical protein
VQLGLGNLMAVADAGASADATEKISDAIQ